MNNELECAQKNRIASMNNFMIRKALTDVNMRQWELADLLGISEATLSRRLRKELPEDIQKKYIAIINENKRNE